MSRTTYWLHGPTIEIHKKVVEESFVCLGTGKRKQLAVVWFGQLIRSEENKRCRRRRRRNCTLINQLINLGSVRS
ncbi:hypothetical protein QVD17_11196 [Tagetes erecta]|uniref:Uncharacterized protein n=1 Tax=Tagetes erecta TaxID=13708 RepID=A0AAD8KZ28_TARER|nr:hypothetical protein QVD17_11196 [Tagetes erecta]